MAKISKSDQQAQAIIAQVKAGAAIKQASDPMGRASWWIVDAAGKVIDQAPARAVDCIWSYRPLPIKQDPSRKGHWIAA